MEVLPIHDKPGRRQMKGWIQWRGSWSIFCVMLLQDIRNVYEVVWMMREADGGGSVNKRDAEDTFDRFRKNDSHHRNGTSQSGNKICEKQGTVLPEKCTFAVPSFDSRKSLSWRPLIGRIHVLAAGVVRRGIQDPCIVFRLLRRTRAKLRWEDTNRRSNFHSVF